MTRWQSVFGRVTKAGVASGEGGLMTPRQRVFGWVTVFTAVACAVLAADCAGLLVRDRDTRTPRAAVGWVVPPLVPGADSYPLTQAALDEATAGPDKTVYLPRGKVTLSKPLVMRGAKVKLRGDRDGGTELQPTFAGHAVVAMADGRPFGPEIGPSLANGPGGALRISGVPELQQRQVAVTTEPGLDLAGVSEFTVRYFFKRINPAPAQAIHFSFGGNYGPHKFRPLAMWDWFDGLGILWDGTIHHIPDVAQEVGKVYYVAVTYGGGTVKVYVGEAGQPASLVKSLPAPANPFRGGGVEILSFGLDANGPLGDLAGWVGPDAWLDGFEVASMVRHPDVFTCPTDKPVYPDAHTRFLCNFETDGPFVKGYGVSGRPSYVLPYSGEIHTGGMEISDITFGGPGSGPCLLDCIYSKTERCEVVNTPIGYMMRGTTYGGVFRELSGNADSFAWVQGPQSMQTVAESLRLGTRKSGSLTFYAHGAVGGSYQGLYLTPHAPVTASMFVSTTNDLNVYSGQIDDEGQAGIVSSVVVIDQAWVKFHGVLLTRHSAGSIVDLYRGGYVEMSGCWLLSQAGAVHQLNFHHAPADGNKAGLLGVRRVPATIPLTNRPAYVTDYSVNVVED
jgi:hypothetical protein